MNSKKNTKQNSKKEYTLTFSIKMKDNEEILEDVGCDWWNPICDDAVQIIYCLNEDEDFCVGFPISNLRKIRHNHGVKKILNEEPYEEKKPEGYN